MFSVEGCKASGVEGFRVLGVEACPLKHRASAKGGRPRRAARKLNPHPKAARSPVESGFLFFVIVGVPMQTSLNTTQEGVCGILWYMRSTAGYHEAGAGCGQLVDSILVLASDHQMGECIEAKSHRHSSICLGRRFIGPAADW